jgi:hypothetical protein
MCNTRGFLRRPTLSGGGSQRDLVPAVLALLQALLPPLDEIDEARQHSKEQTLGRALLIEVRVGLADILVSTGPAPLAAAAAKNLFRPQDQAGRKSHRAGARAAA